MKHQHRQEPAHKSLKVTANGQFFPRSSINLLHCCFPNCLWSRHRIYLCPGRWLTPVRVLAEALPACCSPSSHHPRDLITCHQHPAGFSEGCSTPQQLFQLSEVGQLGERIHRPQSQVVTCLHPCSPLLSCHAFLCSCLAPAGTWISLVYFDSSSG